MTISSLETLPNETSYEIFEYFEACELFETFSTVNNRFRSLCNSSLMPLKMNLFVSRSREAFLENKARLLSLHLWETEQTDAIYSSILIDSSLHHLESITFTSIEIDRLTSLLPQLVSLPRLFSLTVDMTGSHYDLGHIYRLVLDLPKLKYMGCTAMKASREDITISLPPATAATTPISPIEHLLIGHPCVCKDLLTYISHTPQLRRLKFMTCSDFDTDISAIEPMPLLNLTHLSIQTHQLSFDELELLMRKLSTILRVLSLDVMHDDIAYLDANRWERFIVEHSPQLEKFHFKYSLQFGERFEPPMYLGEHDQFLTPFWMERQWILECETESGSLIYSIRPYKTRWYESNSLGSSSPLTKSMQLNIEDPCPERWSQPILFKEHIGHTLSVTHIHHLRVSGHITLQRLSDILTLLPDVETLRVHALLFSDPSKLSTEDIQALCLIIHHRFWQIFLENMETMTDVFFLIIISAHVQHLQLNCVDYSYVETMIGLVLTEAKNEPDHSLRSIGCRVATADDEMLNSLGRMIEEHNLLSDFMIWRNMDKIYLEWE